MKIETEKQRQDRINELVDIVQENRTRSREYRIKYDELISQINELDSELKKLYNGRTILTFIIPSCRRTFNEQAEVLIHSKEKLRQEKGAILDEWNDYTIQWTATEREIESLRRYTITHNLPGGDFNMYYTDDYTLEDGMISFEHKGRLYKIFGSVTISQNQDLPRQSTEN